MSAYPVYTYIYQCYFFHKQGINRLAIGADVLDAIV